MKWIPDAITPGEIDALRIAASQAWADDTRYPLWQERTASVGGGQCYVTALWLTEKLGGYVGKKEGHFAWLSPDKSYVLDLTGDHTGIPIYAKNDGYNHFKAISNKRSKTFIKRANFIFNNLETALRVANDSLTGDPYPAEEPQRKSDIDQQYWHDEPELDNRDQIEQTYNVFYANGKLEVAPENEFSHEDLARHLKIPMDHKGPMASGTVTVKSNEASWNIDANVNLKTLERIFRGYCNQVGWKWGGINDLDGKVVSSVISPEPRSKTYNYVWSNEHLYIGNASHTVLAMNSDDEKPLTGTIKIIGNKAWINPSYANTLDQFFEWANDQGLTLYGSSNNLVERNETMEQKDLGRADEGKLTNPVEGDPEPQNPNPQETENGELKCPMCGQIFPERDMYLEHRKEEHGHSDAPVNEHEDGHFPDPNFDLILPDHYTPTQPEVMSVMTKVDASRVDGFDRYARAFRFQDDEKYYVAYMNGSPVGYAVVNPEHESLRMVYSAVKRKGVMSALLDKIGSHYSYLWTKMAHEWEGAAFERRGWVRVGFNKWALTNGQDPKDLLEDPIPFVYDIPADSITAGHPGQRTSDIPGKFTPAGIVEGMYEPGGTMNITSQTTIPYTINHMLALWYYKYPELSVMRMNMIDEHGNKTKLANNG